MASLPAAPAAAASGSSRAPHQSSSLSQTQPTSIPAQNAGPHLLTLKVMRASAPSLVVSEKPYYDHPEGSSRDGLVEAVGKGIQDGMSHDLLSNRWDGVSAATSAAENFPISNLLVLPNSFGTLYLGETFRTYLCVRNEATIAVREPSLRVEMQVGASDPQQGSDTGRWHQLAHIILPTPTRYDPDPDSEDEKGQPVWELPPAQSLETSLGYDIKDLGPHVLVCTIGYKSRVQEGDDVTWVERSFRKFYKFSVDRSPISVRTKVHQPRHAVHHPDVAVRKRVELEVQVQNVVGNGASLMFDGLALKTAPGWNWESVDRPSLNSQSEGEDMWKGELLADGDVRQYLFRLTPREETSLEEETMRGGIDLGMSPEGLAIRGDALGHLDISWRMSLGEPGRLQTAQLVRRRVVAKPVSATGPAGVKIIPQLRTEVTLRPSALAALRKVRAGDVVDLDINVAVCDVSTLLLPPHSTDTQTRKETEGEEDDDDTPLSEIASSPLSKQRSSPAAVPITIRRTLHLALQHCVIDPPISPATQPSLAAPSDSSTPRKTPTRTETPTGVSALNTRLQANLTNLVRNTSLSSLRPRNSTDSADPNVESRTSTPAPAPALPPKPELGAAAIVTEGSGEAETESIKWLSPNIPWTKVEEKYRSFVEMHAQALIRPSGEHTIPTTFLPSTHINHLSSSLIPLPPLPLHLTTTQIASSFYQSPNPSIQHSPLQTTLSYAVHSPPPDQTLRFGPFRIVLLAWDDLWSDQSGTVHNHTAKGFTVLDEVLVLAETMVLPH